MLLEILEQIKKQGNYAVLVMYGEDVGCDDIDQPQEDRKIEIMMAPVGCLGEVRKIIKTSVKNLNKVDIWKIPTVVSNPPQYTEIQEEGSYVWGVERTLRTYLMSLINNEVE